MFVIAAISLFATALDLGELFADKDAWTVSAVDFTVEHQEAGFKFASQKRDAAVAMRPGACAWYGTPLWETRVYFGEAGVRGVEMSVFNRGDAERGESAMEKREWSLADVEEFALAVNTRLAPDAKRLPAAEKRELRGGGWQLRREWEKAETPAQLVWGVSGRSLNGGRVEFVRLKLLPPAAKKPKGAAGAKARSSGQAAVKAAKANVKRNDDGDVWIANVPMVDQGRKGYCAAAVAERVLRYYEREVDEHEIAQQAQTSAAQGTSVTEMKSAVRAIASKEHLGYSEIVTMIADIGDIEKEIRKYNEAAKALKEPSRLELAAFTHGNMISVGELRSAMKPKVVKKMRTSDGRYRKFLTGVKAQIDAGVPVIWGVTLGLYPEPEIPQVSGGHMRIIIGYNAKTHELIYTDSWGAGHELKRMPEDWAFAITHDAFYLKPL